MSDNYEGRRRARQLKAVMAAQTIAQRLGPGTAKDRVEEIRIACLSAVAEARSVWDFLLSKRIATEAEHQDFLDRGFESVLAQVQGRAAEILTDAGTPH